LEIFEKRFAAVLVVDIFVGFTLDLLMNTNRNYWNAFRSL